MSNFESLILKVITRKSGLCGVSCGFNLIGQPKKKTSNRRRGDAEIEGGEDACGENKHFPPLTSASPRLLFDFLPAVMSPKDGEKTHTGRRRAQKWLFQNFSGNVLFFSALVLWCSVFNRLRPCGLEVERLLYQRKHPGEFRQGVVSRQMTLNQGSDLGVWPMCGWAAPL
jgi:hypothetical protein